MRAIMRLLVIEYNKHLAGFLAKGLVRAGYAIDLVSSASETRSALAATRYVGLILDVGLPDGDGLTILREIRRRGDPVPVILLSARAGVSDRVTGLKCGADDYICKPFAFEELIARLEAILRRPSQMLGTALQLANLVFDTESRQATIDDLPHVLSVREAAVLELLLRRQGRVMPKRLIEDQIFGLTGEVGSNAIEVYVYRLRKRLADGKAKVQICTVRGVGYLIVENK
jgi:DNA-binding response OmpR family regulator